MNNEKDERTKIKVEGYLKKLEWKTDDNGSYIDATIRMRNSDSFNTLEFEYLRIGDVEIVQKQW